MIPFIFVAVAIAFFLGMLVGAIIIAKQYNGNTEQIFGICRFGKPVKVIRFDFYDSNIVDLYSRWLSMIKKGRPLKPGELTKGSAERRVADVQGDNRQKTLQRGFVCGLAQRSDVHPLGS